MKDKQIERLKRKCVIHHCEGKISDSSTPSLSNLWLFFSTLNEEIEMKGGKFWGGLCCSDWEDQILGFSRRRAAKPADKRSAS